MLMLSVVFFVLARSFKSKMFENPLVTADELRSLINGDRTGGKRKKKKKSHKKKSYKKTSKKKSRTRTHVHVRVRVHTNKSKRLSKKPSDKFERCVMDVKAKGSAVNPWAVCNASIYGKTKKTKRKRVSN
jgi:hypothetical protein